MAATLAILAAYGEGDDLAWTYDGRLVKMIDDWGFGSGGTWFVAGHEHGATHVIHARSFESAWEAWIDECPTIDVDELPEAYGIDDSPEMKAWEDTHRMPPWHACTDWAAWREARTAEAKRILAQWDEDAREGRRDDGPELIQGYEYQANATGTGIVYFGHYSWLQEIDDLTRVTVELKGVDE